MGSKFKNINNPYLTCSAGEGGGRVVQGGASEILGGGGKAAVQNACANLKNWLIVGGSRSEEKAVQSADGKTGSGEGVVQYSDQS